MGFLHIANTNFEEELETGAPFHPTENKIALQLQFLPDLYSADGDALAATYRPREHTVLPVHLLFENKPLVYSSIEPWGHTPSIAAWARAHNIAYEMPPWEVVKEVNSKRFSWEESPLPGSALLHDLGQVEAWLKKTPGAKVLKSCFGMAGRGHLFDWKRLEPFCTAQFKRGLAIIGEPWVDRSLDFSTQWVISKTGDIAYLGATVCISSAQGRHLENRAGTLHLPFLEKHQLAAEKTLRVMAKRGFFGNVGVDAFVYAQNQLQLIVEINARKTMGFVALQVQQRHFPKQTISLSYGAGQGSRLPDAVIKENGSVVQFSKTLRINASSI